LMRTQGGELMLIETTGAGTTFRLTMPAAAAPARTLSRASG